MTKINFAKPIAIALLACIIQGTSCKNKSKEKATNVDTTVQSTTTAPVTIANDDELKNGIKDATKDFPEVTATVNNGEVTLTGTIKRDRLPTLMQSIQSLRPKKVDNKLTIQ
jgi:osmotically-inducible protein OsmY